jgi:hypothetical protein
VRRDILQADRKFLDAQNNLTQTILSLQKSHANFGGTMSGRNDSSNNEFFHALQAFREKHQSEESKANRQISEERQASLKELQV